MTSHRKQGGDLTRLLPDDVLAAVLGRLAPRCLAASRRVCKAWRAVIDARGLLRADLLPLSLDGIILQFRGHVYSEFFSRPSTPTGRPSISDTFEHLLTTNTWGKTDDHCNGLLLLSVFVCRRRYKEYVANPATGWAAPLPPCPPPCLATHGDYHDEYLLFDPAVSAHYEVFSVPRLFKRNLVPEVLGKSEWPPSPFIMRVYSSVSQMWEERSFSREGEPARTNAGGIRCYGERRYAVCWRGSLYVHCETDSVIRISSSNNRLRVIEPPAGIRGDTGYGSHFHLGRSEKGVYFASLCDWRFLVWILDESCDHTKWVLRHDNNIGPVLPRRAPPAPRNCPGSNQHVRGPWTLQDVNYRSGVLDRVFGNTEPLSRPRFKRNPAPPSENLEWSSDGDDALDDKDMMKEGYLEYIHILGFHPYKEIVFFGQLFEVGLAYYLNTSRFQVLGNIDPTNYDDFIDLPGEREINVSFPYTPCLTETCPRNN